MKAVIAVLAGLLFAQSSFAQAPANNTIAAPAGVSKDPLNAPSGSYKMDPDHTSIIARIGHRSGLSFTTFRFYTAAGTLDWNPRDSVKTRLAVTVDMTSIQTPVAGFAATLIGDHFLKTAQFHDATFTSTEIQQTGPAAARIQGDLTFMGQTRPETIEATMVGNTLVKGNPVMGFHGILHFKRSDFGFTALTGPIADDIEMVLDTEFDKVP